MAPRTIVLLRSLFSALRSPLPFSLGRSLRSWHYIFASPSSSVAMGMAVRRSVGPKQGGGASNFSFALTFFVPSPSSSLLSHLPLPLSSHNLSHRVTLQSYTAIRTCSAISVSLSLSGRKGRVTGEDSTPNAVVSTHVRPPTFASVPRLCSSMQ